MNQPTVILSPSMDGLSNPFGELEQIMARPLVMLEIFAVMLGTMAAITDRELFTDADAS